MYPKIISLYGPFELNSYNTAIMIGIGLFLYFANRDRRRELLMSSTEFLNLCTESALAALLGARLLHIMTHYKDYPDFYSLLKIWDGGLSILGALFAVLAYGYWAQQRRGKSFLAIADLASPYLPLIHATGRIGCFLVGCCHGAVTHVAWAVTYTDPRVLAPLNCSLHPSQLYSSALYFLLFFALWVYNKSSIKRPLGTLTCLYIMGMSFERFCIDFFRGDRIMLSANSPFSWYQWIAIAIFMGASVAFVRIRSTSVGAHESL